MKIKLVVRFNNFVIDTLDLEPGNYDIGRGSENDVNINHPSIRRKHGKLSFGNGAWTYQEYTSSKIQRITDREPIFLSSEIDIATEDFTLTEVTSTHIQNPFSKKRMGKDKLLYGFLIGVGLVLGTALTYFLLRNQLKHSDPNALLAQVRSKVVEFEKKRDPVAIEDYKKIGKFTDADFRDNIGFCTGFLVAPNVVLTASHCLWGSDLLDIQTNFEIRTSDDKKYSPKRVLGFDAVRDFLFIEMEGMESYGHLDFAEDYKIGQTVYTLGNAHGQGIAIREGIMASETADVNDASIKFIRFSAGASPGNSGGPLLDPDGRIVALVFAATGAENYNLGTSAKDLMVGFNKYVKNRSPKNIKVSVKKLFNFNLTQFLQKQVLPYLPEYNEFPEIAQQINTVEFTFKVPMDFATVAKDMLSEIQTRSSQAVADVEKALLAKNEVVLDWLSFVSSRTPAIHPSQFDSSQNSFYFHNGRYYMEAAGFLDSPNRKDYKQYLEQLEKEKKFDFQAYGMNSEIKVPLSSDQLLYLPRDANKSKASIEDLAQGTLYSQMMVGARIDDPQLVKNILKNYLKEGVLASSYSAFIRPQSYKNFTMDEINKPTDQETVTDGSGRSWRRFHFKVFDQIHFYIYCLPFPEAVQCTVRVIPVENDFRREQMEANFREHILSHFLENPYFWQPSPLIDFMSDAQSQGFTSLKGTKLSKNALGYALQLQTFKMEMQIPLTAQSIRIQTGMYLGKNKKTEWTGFGAEWVEAGAKPKLCGLGVEPLGSQSIFILNYLRDSLKRMKLKDDEKDKKTDIPKLWTGKAMTSLGDEVQVYGYCAPLRENPMKVGFYFADFQKALPRTTIFKILK